MNVSARHTKRLVVLSHRSLVGCVQQAVHMPLLVVVQLELRNAKLIGLVSGSIRTDSVDCPLREL